MPNDTPATKEDINHIHAQIDVLKDERIEDLNVLRAERKEDMEHIKELLSPLKDIMETYQTASKMGKWVMGAAVFISILLGIILSFKTLIK